MARIKADAFWDGGSNRIRCSSVGEDANSYLDPESQRLEGSGNRSLGSFVSGRYGLKGVIIPRHTALGGSRGFDPEKPALVNIDPDIKGQSCVVDMSKVTKEQIEEAYAAACEDPLVNTDISLIAAQTYHNLAEMSGTDNVPVKRPETRKLANLGRDNPVPGAYVVPKSKPGGGQVTENEVKSPYITPRFRTKKAAQEVVQEEPQMLVEEFPVEYQSMQPKFQDQSEGNISRFPQTKPKISLKSSISVPVNRNSTPQIKVTFEMEGFGTFEAMYHEVIKSDCLLILVTDCQFKGGMKFSPPATEKLLAVSIDGKDEVYLVNSCGNKFTHDDYLYHILVIDQEASTKE